MFFYFGPNVLFSTGIAILMSLHDNIIDGDLACIMENFSHISEYITDPEKLIALIGQVKISENCSNLIKNL